MEPPATPLLGREDEQRAVDALLMALRAGRSGALVLVGEPGSGKTRLLEHVAGSAEGVRTLRICGVGSETGVGHGGLHRLLAPLLDRAAALPQPQREALRARFGLVAGPLPDRLLLGVATLALLTAVAADRPLLVLVDDGHWIDAESLDLLGFVGRRLRDGAIGLVVAASDCDGVPAALEGLPVHRLSGLAPGDARALLSSRAGPHLDGGVLARVLAETGGNPLALTELAARLTGAQLVGGSALPAHLPMGRQIEARFLQRVRALPQETRSLLLVASAMAPGDPALLWGASGLVGLPPQAADPAVGEGILSLTPLVAFPHPLVQATVYGAAAADDRRRVHAVLAAALEDGDAQGRAWHLGAAAVGLDDQVATELARAAEGEGAGHGARAALLSRAAELTGNVEARSLRRLAAARSHLVAGDVAAATALLRQVRGRPGEPSVLLQVRQLDAAIERAPANAEAIPGILLDAVADAGARDPLLVRDVLLDALVAALIAGPRTGGSALHDLAVAVRASPRRDEATGSDLLLDGFATRTIDGYVAGVPLLRAALTELCDGAQGAVRGIAVAVAGCTAAEDLWDDRGHRRLLDRLDGLNRVQGALFARHVTLLGLAFSQLWAGRFAEASGFHGEASAVGTALGSPFDASALQVELLAWQGREADARAAAAAAFRACRAGPGYGALMDLAGRALGVLELSLGRYHDALEVITPVFERDAPGYGNHVLADLVEAAVRAGDRVVAARALDRLVERAPASGTPWAQGQLARGRALLARGDADEHYRASIDHLRQTSVTTELARSHLLYGEWLRRRNRRTQAREQLREAHDRFAAMGALAFSERARLELLATGERARPPGTASAKAPLTPQERRIAALAAQGETNAEIALRVFVTASTVEYHLTNVFRKLGVTSRRHLARELPEQDLEGGG